MAHLMDVFLHVAVVLLIAPSCGGQKTDKSPHQSVTVMLGKDVVLPCQLDPPVDAVSMIFEWGRPDLKPRFVLVWHDGKELPEDQNKAYKGRASLSVDKLKRGDLQLTLTEVKISDNGTYRCYIPKMKKEMFVDLIIGAASPPSVSLAGMDKANHGVMLDCESKGWYPQPELMWLDAEGHLLSAGAPGSVKGPDDLYTISSRVTVKKTASNNFTCKLQQRNINQTRERSFHVPDDFFLVPRSCSSSIAISVVFVLIIISIFAFMAWKLRNNKKEKKKRNEDREALRESLMMESKKVEELEKLKLSEDSQRKEIEELKETLMGLTRELEKQRDYLTYKWKEAESLVKEHERKVKSVEEEVSEKKGDSKEKKAQGYLKIREICKEAGWNHENFRKKEIQHMQMITDKLMKMTMDAVKKIKEMNNKEKDNEKPSMKHTSEKMDQKTKMDST
ncbi:butyrophilin subfamily 2 member A2-like [Cheilinus undulatus]|uniref:butyrophilin subfamily 2 member A2-like n=1 Tax=Cheilinus undulatus TaxID=241271 RepID=UPI001BD26613|nr:butyrophilin subfamily 2 member A2-like [Cheilinus undulatus]